MSAITVRIGDLPPATHPAGTIVGRLAPPVPDGGLPYLAALVNNDLASLSYPLAINCRVRFLSMADRHGWRVYRRSLCFLLAKAVGLVCPEAVFSVEHSMGSGLFCSFQAAPGAQAGIAADTLKRIQDCMRELVNRDLPIVRCKTAYTEALDAFRRSNQVDKLTLLQYRNPPHVVTHCCDGFDDLAHGPLAPGTGVLDRFELISYRAGFVLHLPSRDHPADLQPFEDQPHLFNIFQEHKEWGRILGVSTVGRLNKIIADGGIADFVRTAEALHEKKLAQIADDITGKRDRLRMILVAGPSAAGKTTFAKRLTVHLKANGLQPVVVSTDDYFVGQERNPRDENGHPDFEHLEAVDLELFNLHMRELSEGSAIDRPRFNFTTKQREYRGESMQLQKDDILIVEGIHGLNPRLTADVPGELKFRIFVSALTQLNMDAHNRVSTTDNRLMRRMVRDNQYRSHTALDTLRLWPSVRRGEKRWIFPFQSEADATFNSALDYELAILKTLVEPLLMQVKPSHAEYAEARRLSEFLLNFLPAPAEAVPHTSILREYIGGSDFAY